MQTMTSLGIISHQTTQEKPNKLKKKKISDKQRGPLQRPFSPTPQNNTNSAYTFGMVLIWATFGIRTSPDQLTGQRLTALLTQCTQYCTFKFIMYQNR